MRYDKGAGKIDEKQRYPKPSNDPWSRSVDTRLNNLEKEVGALKKEMKDGFAAINISLDAIKAKLDTR